MSPSPSPLSSVSSPCLLSLPFVSLGQIYLLCAENLAPSYLCEELIFIELSVNIYLPLTLADEEKIWPPCIRVIVIRSPVLQMGSLFIITAVSPATIGR